MKSSPAKPEVAAVLPLSNEMVRNASSDIFANRYPDHPLTHELAAVARRIGGERALETQVHVARPA